MSIPNLAFQRVPEVIRSPAAEDLPWQRWRFKGSERFHRAGASRGREGFCTLTSSYACHHRLFQLHLMLRIHLSVSVPLNYSWTKKS